MQLPEPHAPVGRSATPLLLDGIEIGDAFGGLLGDERAFSLEDVENLRLIWAMQATSRTPPGRRISLKPE